MTHPNQPNEPCVLNEICESLGLPRHTRMVEVLERIRMLQYYYGQLMRVERMASDANG